MIAAVDAAAGEVDADVAVFELGDPGAGGEAVPWNDAPGCWMRVAAEDGDFVVVRVEVAGEDLADLAGAAGDDDSQGGVYLATEGGVVVGAGR
jgi:hypothetical protein